MERKKEYIKDIPRLTKEFDTENNSFPIDNITTGSNKTVNWVCEKGHTWGTTPYRRAKRGQNCPYCAGNLPIKGESDLATCYPDVAKEWHPTKNKYLKPEDFKSQSNKKVWWLCPKEHEYESAICARTSRENGCPYCSGRHAIEGVTDLETLRPDIAEQWHPTKNGDIKPNTVMVGSDSKYWWLCLKGHEYEMIVQHRTKKGKGKESGCPYCARKKPIPGETDLGTACKESYQFWYYDKNNTTPFDYLPNSGAKVWMRCDKGHSWNQTLRLFARSRKCPYCSETILEKGINTLRALYPNVAEKWDYEKNATIDIDTVRVGSSMKQYWWKCKKGHSWMKAVDYMVKSIKSKGNGCPYCSGSISKYSI